MLKMLDNMISACMNGAVEPEVLNTAIFNTTIKILIKSGDHLADKCGELLLRMEHYYFAWKIYRALMVIALVE